RLAAGKAGGKEAPMPARRGRRRQKAGEKGVVGRIRKIPRRVPLLPTPAGQHGGQVRRPPLGQRVAGDVVAQRVQGDEQQVVRADQGASVDHRRTVMGARSVEPFAGEGSAPTTARSSAAYVSSPSDSTPGSRSPKALTSSTACRRQPGVK